MFTLTPVQDVCLRGIVSLFDADFGIKKAILKINPPLVLEKG